MSLTPYFQDSACTIYHGDCREILPQLPKVDLVLTDPPYGIDGSVTGLRASGRSKGDYSGKFDDTPEYIASVVAPAIQFCIGLATRVCLTPGTRCMHLYPKPDHIGSFQYPGSTVMSMWGPMLWQPIFYYGKDPHPGKLMPDSRVNCTDTDRNTDHPCPKPMKSWMWLMRRTSRDGETILDPFMGSGTTLRAAKDLGRKAIGIELEEKYCEIAAKRLAQEVLAL